MKSTLFTFDIGKDSEGRNARVLIVRHTFMEALREVPRKLQNRIQSVDSQCVTLSTLPTK